VFEFGLAREDDLQEIGKIVNHYIERGTSHFGTTALDERDVRAFARHPMHACFVGRREGELVGAAWSAPHKTREAYAWTVDVAVYLKPGEGGAGLGKLLQARVVRCLKAQGYVSALAVIVCPNEASVRLHESLGFEPVGVMPNMGFKQGRWHDVGVWHLRLRDPGEGTPLILSVEQALSDVSHAVS
jgi:phosphinothricin acetyltransferase